MRTGSDEYCDYCFMRVKDKSSKIIDTSKENSNIKELSHKKRNLVRKKAKYVKRGWEEEENHKVYSPLQAWSTGLKSEVRRKHLRTTIIQRKQETLRFSPY